MQESSEHIVILNTCPDKDTGEKIARALVDAKLAACVNIIPGVISTYRWKGEICRDEEALLLIKTRTADFKEVENMIKKLHPYDVPEIIALPITKGSKEYLEWLSAGGG